MSKKNQKIYSKKNTLRKFCILGLILISILNFNMRKDLIGSNKTEDSIIQPDEYYIDKLEKIIGQPIMAVDRASLMYSTLLGGTTGISTASSIAVDNFGCAYITGYTSSTDFPTTPNAINQTYNGGNNDVFVCKISADGTSLVYSTLLGGLETDEAYGIVVDNAGCAYITGITENGTVNFPTTSNVVNETHNGNDDVFICKINADGTALDYSTFLGGSGYDASMGIVIDNIGCAYITGYTSSTDFPTTPNAINQTYNGMDDVFVSKINPDGKTLNYSTYLGCSEGDYAYGIAIDNSQCVYITGVSFYMGLDLFPTTPGVYSRTHNGGQSDGFLSKINAEGTALEYSTLIGGTDFDHSIRIAVDSEQCAIITGFTISTDFPTTLNALNSTFNGGDHDIFISKFNSNGSSLIFSTYLGSIDDDIPLDIKVDNMGDIYISGVTKNSTSNFPTIPGAINETHNGEYDVFISKINKNGTLLQYSTFLGGSGMDQGSSIVIDNFGSIYITGVTQNSTLNYPTTTGAMNETHNGITSIFISKLQIMGDFSPEAAFSVNQTTILEGQFIEFTFTGTRGNLPANLQWNFGDDMDNSTIDNPVHQFTTSGNYTISLTITDSDGDTSTNSMIIIVEKKSGIPLYYYGGIFVGCVFFIIILMKILKRK